jgi:hypothetical protein
VSEKVALVAIRYGLAAVPVPVDWVLTLHATGWSELNTAEPKKLEGRPGGVDGVK